MHLHSDRNAILRRLSERVDDLVTGFKGPVFRFINPDYSKAKEMFAGKGPLHAHGRWLLQGKLKATYTSLLPETALAEALAAGRYYGFPDHRAAPLVFVTAEATLRRVVDLTEGAVRQRLRIAAAAIVDCDWRHENLNGREAITQAWGWALAMVEVGGFLCPSAVHPGATNLIVFPEKGAQPERLTVTSEVKWPR